MKQAFGISMRMPFWANLFLNSHGDEYMTSLIYSDEIKARHFSTKYFIDDLCTINDSGEFGRSICDINLKELELKAEYNCKNAS